MHRNENRDADNAETADGADHSELQPRSLHSPGPIYRHEACP